MQTFDPPWCKSEGYYPYFSHDILAFTSPDEFLSLTDSLSRWTPWSVFQDGSIGGNHTDIKMDGEWEQRWQLIEERTLSFPKDRPNNQSPYHPSTRMASIKVQGTPHWGGRHLNRPSYSPKQALQINPFLPSTPQSCPLLMIWQVHPL